MPAITCTPQVSACLIRVSRLDSSGTPVESATGSYVSDALTTLTVTPEIEEGEEFIVKNGCGIPCVNYKAPDTIKRLTVELTLCTPDPRLHEILSGGTVLTDGEAVGWAMPALAEEISPNGIAIELWAKRIGDDGSDDPDFPYARWLFPRVKLTPGARTFEFGPLSSPFTGNGYENPQFLNGPTNDWPVASSKAMQWIPVTEDDLPDVSCDYVETLFS